MKKITVQAVIEESEHYCDKHSDVKANGRLKMDFGYGSKYDLESITLDICDDCADKIIEFLKSEFNESVKLEEVMI